MYGKENGREQGNYFVEILFYGMEELGAINLFNDVLTINCGDNL